MDFELSSEQKDVQRAATEFARGEFDPDLVSELDENGAFPDSLWKKAAQLGFIGIHYPEAFGGQGLGLFENLLAFLLRNASNHGERLALAVALELIQAMKHFLLRFIADAASVVENVAGFFDGRNLTVAL